ncbi:tetratricopeptide repeat-containing diguanylate cyclase [Halomonas denitrificans]|nr:GGDEF domain-containing protein [Halomonas denitrificans]
MNRTLRARWRVMPVVVLLWTAATAGAVDREAFGQRLELAARLNIEAPWRESQAVLDELRPHLGLATGDQLVTFLMLESRNQALNGEITASLATVDRLLDLDLDPDQRLAAHARAANVGYIGRQFEPTFRHLNDAFELIEAADGTEGVSQIYSIAAYVYALVEEFEDAREFGEQAVAIARGSASIRELCAAHERLAFVHKRSGNFEEAETHYQAALDACPAGDHPLINGAIEYGFADLLQAAGRFERARPRFERGIDAMLRMNYRNGLAEARVFRARMAHREGDESMVEALLTSALPDLDAAGHDEYRAEAHRVLADLDHRRGRHGQAYEHLAVSLAAREAHLAEVRARETSFLRARFASAAKERELARLREQQRISELEARSQAQQSQLRLVVSIAAALLLLAVSVLWIRAARDRRRFRRLAQRDALTALSNHTRFFELAERTLALAREKRRPFTLVLADIDHFKQVNDRHGHLVGDQVLRHVGTRLRESLGRIGIIGRVGGEEFAVAVPGVERAEVRQRLEQLRRELVAVRVDGVPVPVTMSFGLASPRGDESLIELRKRADQRLYAAKQAGRDRIDETAEAP